MIRFNNKNDRLEVVVALLNVSLMMKNAPKNKKK